MTDRFAIFKAIPRPSRAGAWSAESPNGTAWRVGRSFEGHAAVLISFATFAGTSTPRRLTNIAYLPPSSVEVVDEAGAVHEGRFAVLECRSEDALLAQYFFRLVGVLMADAAIADESALETALDALINLFRALQRPAQRTVQGLWGELALIVWATEPSVALHAWHSSPRALHDFAAGDEHLEVKSSASGLREHKFRLEQLTRGGKTVIASLLLQEVDDGASVIDLVQTIVRRIGDSEALGRLETVVAQSLGIDWRDAHGVRFDLDAARDALRFYAADAVPSVDASFPPQVKDVSFTVDLSSTSALARESVASLGVLFAALVG